MTEQEEIRRGEMLIQLLALPKRAGQVSTLWGTKTPLGLYRTIKRIVEEGK